MIMIPKCNTTFGDNCLKKWLTGLNGTWYVFTKDTNGKLIYELNWTRFSNTNTTNIPKFVDTIIDMHHSMPVWVVNNGDFFPTSWRYDWEDMIHY